MSEWRSEPNFLLWPFLEKIAGNELTKLVGIIPIAGYLILFNDGIAEHVSFDTIAGITEGIEDPFWLTGVQKLRLTFFGSIVLFSSNILFRSFSPKVLEQSKSEFDFAGRVISSYSVLEIKTLASEVFDGNWRFRSPLLLEHERYSKYAEKNKNYLENLKSYRPREDLFRIDSDFPILLAREWWLGKMHLFPRLRKTVFVTAVIGYLLLAIPSLDIAQAVIQDFLG